jgi:hypothetical protein
VAFDGVASLPPSCGIGGALSTSSLTSTPSGRPPALELNTSVAHAPALGAHDQGGIPLSRFGDFRPPSVSIGPDIDLKRTPSIGCGTPTGLKKPCCMSTADMPRAVNLFSKMPAPDDEVMAHPSFSIGIAGGLERQPIGINGRGEDQGNGSSLFVNCHCRNSWGPRARPS